MPLELDAMTDRSQFLGRRAGATQIVFAVLLGSVASFASEPGFLPRGVVVLGVFGIPGVVGLLGVRTRRPALLVAAGLTSAIGSFTAFSLVTLIFLIPSVLFLIGSAQLAIGERGAPRGSWVGGLARVGIAVAIIPLLVAGGASALLITDSACWTDYPSAFGVRVEIQPYSNGEMEIPPGASSMSCGTGLISPRGVGLAVLLDGAAIGLAVLASRRRPRAGA